MNVHPEDHTAVRTLMTAAGMGIAMSLAMATGNGFMPVIQRDPTLTSSAWFIGEQQESSNFVVRPTVPFHPQPVTTNARLLEQLRSQSGLTWEQIARLFNVSRRSIHLWLAGGRMSAGNEERLVRIEQYVSSLSGTPDEKRHQLLASSESGMSYFDQERMTLSSTLDDINRQVEPLTRAQ